MDYISTTAERAVEYLCQLYDKKTETEMLNDFAMDTQPGYLSCLIRNQPIIFLNYTSTTFLEFFLLKKFLVHSYKQSPSGLIPIFHDA